MGGLSAPTVRTFFAGLRLPYRFVIRSLIEKLINTEAGRPSKNGGGLGGAMLNPPAPAFVNEPGKIGFRVGGVCRSIFNDSLKNGFNQLLKVLIGY